MRSNKARFLFLFYNAAVAGLFGMIFTVSNVYQVVTAKLDPLQLVLVGTVLELSVFLFEMPTGIVADTYSRRLSVIIGVFLIGIGFLVEGTWPLFSAILVAQVFWGVGFTFTSGAAQAWISDEIGEENAATAFFQSARISPIASLVGLFIGTGLGTLRVNLPIQLGGGLFLVLGILLSLSMPEEGFRPTPMAERSTWQKLLYTFRGGLQMVRSRPSLGGIMGIGLFYGLYSEGFDRLWVAHLIDRFAIPQAQLVLWFGLIRGVGMLLSAAAAGLAQQRLDLTRTRVLAQAIAVISLGLVVGLALFAGAQSLALAVAVYWFITILRSLQEPVYTTWVNHRLESQVRATVISMSSLVDALGQITGGPLIGTVARLVSIPAGIYSSSALLAPVLLLLSRRGVQRED